MSYSYELNELDMRLATLPWQVDGDKLVLKGQTAGIIRGLAYTQPSVVERIALMAQRFNVSCAKLVTTRLNKTRTMNIPAGAAAYNYQPGTMTNQTLITQVPDDDNFIWYSGIYSDKTRPTLDRMKSSSKAMGIVLPYIQNGVLKTMQMGINPPSIKLFGFDKTSYHDMMQAILRDTSGDWYGPDLEKKRQKYQHEGTHWEQVARIRAGEGYFLMHFRCERIDNTDLVLSWGTKESEVVDTPELLRV